MPGLRRGSQVEVDSMARSLFAGTSGCGERPMPALRSVGREVGEVTQEIADTASVSI